MTRLAFATIIAALFAVQPAAAQDVPESDPLGLERRPNRTIELLATADVGQVSPAAVEQVQSLTFRANFAALGEITRWDGLNPVTSRGVELYLPWHGTAGFLEMNLRYPPPPVTLPNMTLPQCVPVIAGWEPLYISQTESGYRVGIWKPLSGPSEQRSVVLFANDYRCPSEDAADERFAILLQGPIRWRFAEVRHIHHSGTSIGLVSEVAHDRSVTVAILGLTSSPYAR